MIFILCNLHYGAKLKIQIYHCSALPHNAFTDAVWLCIIVMALELYTVSDDVISNLHLKYC